MSDVSNCSQNAHSSTEDLSENGDRIHSRQSMLPVNDDGGLLTNMHHSGQCLLAMLLSLPRLSDTFMFLACFSRALSLLCSHGLGTNAEHNSEAEPVNYSYLAFSPIVTRDGARSESAPEARAAG